jgi:hypothetical protein
MDKKEVLTILERAKRLEDGKEVALAKEFIAIDNKFNEVSNTLKNLNTKMEDPIEVELVIE